jgi:hypothetical protein
VVLHVFPTEALPAGCRCDPTAIHGRAGRYGYDTMTLIARLVAGDQGAVDAALTAVDLVRGDGDQPGMRSLRAVPPARPSCHSHRLRRLRYLNNAAVAAEALRRPGGPGRDRGPGRPSRQRHPGDLLRPAGRALRLAAHRPGRRLVPHYVGYAEERGAVPAPDEPEPAATEAPATAAGWPAD